MVTINLGFGIPNVKNKLEAWIWHSFCLSCTKNRLNEKTKKPAIVKLKEMPTRDMVKPHDTNAQSHHHRKLLLSNNGEQVSYEENI